MHELRPGDTLRHRGQNYLLCASEPFTRVNGTATVIHTWAAYCEECDGPFLCSTGPRLDWLPRLCPWCRRLTDRAKNPIAVARRVLAVMAEERELSRGGP